LCQLFYERIRVLRATAIGPLERVERASHFVCRDASHSGVAATE
jgi:hypothetical protein